MYRVTLLAVAAFAAAPLAAQEAAPAPAPQPTQQQIETAARHYSVISGAIQSDEVPQEVKNQLFGCLYSASLRRISEAVTAVFEQNSQLSADNPEHVQGAIGAVCGVQPDPNAEPLGAPEGR